MRSSDYQFSYALSNSEATDGSNRTEFLNNAFNKLDPANRAYFGATGLDHRHSFSAALNTYVPFGFHIGQIWSFRTAPPLDLYVPDIGLTGGDRIFSTDLNGAGGSGSAPFPNILPGTKVGALGRSIKSWGDLNKLIANYNSNFAGKLTPSGQRLVSAGLFTQAQMVTLGAVTPNIPLVPTTNPWPFDNFFNLDMTLSRPIKLSKLREGLEIEPIVQAFNLFNNNGLNPYNYPNVDLSTGLDALFGSLNYDYRSAKNNAVLPGNTAADSSCQLTDKKGNDAGANCVKQLELQRGRNNINRQFQVGLRITF